MTDTADKASALNRRGFLRLMAGAAGAGVLSLPVARWGLRAEPPERRRAERTLILNLFGGQRSSAAFCASGDPRFNPWGRLSGTGSLKLGRLLDDHLPDPRLAPPGSATEPIPDVAYRLGGAWEGMRMPRFASMGDRFSVVGSWNERRGDHITSQIEETTGGSRNDPGLLTRIHMGLGELDVPPFALDVADSVFFGVAPGLSSRFAPVGMVGPQDLPGASPVPHQILDRVGQLWTADEAMFESLDRHAAAHLGGARRAMAENHAALRRSRARLGSRLAEPWLRPDGGASSFGEVALPSGNAPLTSAMLREVFVRGLGPHPDDPSLILTPDLVLSHPHFEDALNLALAIRLLQLGAPVAVVEIKNFDMHGDERLDGPERYRTLGRWWASLHWLLSHMIEPTDPALRMLDRTMVVTTSEFGRDPGGPSGFNDGDGTDHGIHPSTFFLAHAVMGAGIAPGIHHSPVDTEGGSAFDPRRIEGRFGHHDFLSTILFAMGLDPHAPEFGFPDTGTPITRLWGGA